MSDRSTSGDTAEEIILTINAIPSTQISSKSQTEINEDNCVQKARRMRFKNCAICGIIKNEVSFHRFPVAPDIRAKWASFCGLDVEKLGNFPVICGNHFTENDFMEHKSFRSNEKLLKENSIPSRNPPVGREEFLTEELNYETIIVDGFSNSAMYLEDEKTTDYIVKNEPLNKDGHSCNEHTEDNTDYQCVSASSEDQKRAPLICKRKFPRYFMDIKSQDVRSPKYAKLCLEMGREAITNYRRKINTLQHQNKRLQNKLLSAEEIFRQLKNNTISMSEALIIIERKQIFRFGNKSCFI